MKEVFKPIKGFEGLYEISNLGRLKRLSFRNSKGRLFEEHICKRASKKGWYYTANLNKQGKMYTKHIHRVVYETFVGIIPDGYDIHHIDGNKHNNIITNLKMLSEHEHHQMHSQNASSYFAMNMKNMLGRSRKVVAYRNDGTFFACFPNARFASIATNVCERNINQVANRTEFKPGRIRAQAGGYKWFYRDEINN